MTAAAGSVARARLPAAMERTRVVAVLRAGDATEYSPVVEALLRGGVSSIELTLSTRGVFGELPVLRRRFGTAVELGVGTVTTVREAELALEAGADYLVTPTTDERVIAAGLARGVAVVPGGFTPTELHLGWSLGCPAVKLFPASQLGPGYLGHLRGPFPDMLVMPSGGVAIDDAAAWIRAGSPAVSLGGPLVGDAFRGGDLGELAARASTVRRLVDEAAAG